MEKRNIEEYIYNDNNLNILEISNRFFDSQLKIYDNTITNIKKELNKETNVNDVIDKIFEIHTSLKHHNLLKKRSAHTALASVIKIQDTRITDALDSIKNIFLCVICKDICNKSKIISCCNNLYCNDCISSWITYNDTCPMCRKKIEFGSISDNIYLDKVISEIKSISEINST